MENYSGNSNRSKERTVGSEKKKVEKVIHGGVKTKKKTEMQKLTDIFLADDVGNVKEYILFDVLVPAVKKALSDIVTNGIDMVLYGETGHTKKNGTASKISYRGFYEKESERKNNTVNRTRAGYRYDDIILETRGEAEDVLTSMDDLVDAYGMVSVADLYDLVDITGDYTDNNYGWADIRSASVVRTKDGYLLKLPKVIPLK